MLRLGFSFIMIGAKILNCKDGKNLSNIHLPLDKYDKRGENFGMQNFGTTDAKSIFLEVLSGF